jgi:hypothetical protein
MPRQQKSNPKNDRRYSAASVSIDESRVEAMVRLAPVGDAQRAIGKLSPGVAVTGITKGQFSLLELVRAILDQTGPAHVVISTWTFGIRDAEMAAWLVRPGGPMLSLRFLVDRHFESREPKYCARIRQLFGPDSIVLSVVHAKFATIKNDQWQIAVRSSMNLNRNPRWEQFDINDCPRRVAFFDGVVAELQSIQGTGFDSDPVKVDIGFQRVGFDQVEQLLVEKEQADKRTAEKEAARLAQHPPAAQKPPPVKVDPASVVIPSSEFEFWEQQYRDLTASVTEATSDRSWVAVGQLQKQRSDVHKQMQASRAASMVVETPEQQNDALRAQVRTAPKSLRWDILQDILADNPDWVGDDTPDNVVPING